MRNLSTQGTTPAYEISNSPSKVNKDNSHANGAHFKEFYNQEINKTQKAMVSKTGAQTSAKLEHQTKSATPKTPEATPKNSPTASKAHNKKTTEHDEESTSNEVQGKGAEVVSELLLMFGQITENPKSYPAPSEQTESDSSTIHLTAMNTSANVTKPDHPQAVNKGPFSASGFSQITNTTQADVDVADVPRTWQDDSSGNTTATSGHSSKVESDATSQASVLSMPAQAPTTELPFNAHSSTDAHENANPSGKINLGVVQSSEVTPHEFKAEPILNTVKPEKPVEVQTVQALAGSQSAQVMPQTATQQLASNQIAPRLGSAAWDKAVGQKIVWMSSENLQSAQLTLNPPDLGPLQVVLKVSNDHADASFFAPQPEVRAALENALPRLREMLSDAGVQLSGFSVSAQNSGHGQSANEHAMSKPFSIGSASVSPSAAQTESVKPTPLRIYSNTSAIDTFA